MKGSYKTFYAGIVLFSFLLTGMGSCGMLELFGERDSNPTKPCGELIPTPTPIPLITVTPEEIPSQPSDSSDCSDGPGTAVICDGQVVTKAVFVILPTPTPTPMPTPTVTVAPPSQIVIWELSPLSQGNLGGYTALTTSCTSMKPSSVAVAYPFLSDSTHDVSSLPAPSGVPVVSVLGIQIAATWSDLWTPTLTNSLSIAGVTTAFWWSGSNMAGAATFDLCSDWTSNSNLISGTVGNAAVTSSLWISSGPFSCDASAAVLCVGW